MNVKEFKEHLVDPPAMSFREIGEKIGVSSVRAFQIYKAAVEKIINNLEEEEMEEILEALAEAQPEESLYEIMTEQMYLQEDRDTLRGFWKEKELNCK